MEVRGFDDTIQWYDDNAEQYSAVSKAISFEESIKEFLKKLPPAPRVLEAGCGTGRDARTFTDNGATVTGVDISEGLLTVARRENPDITFIRANLTTLPFENESFDGVWSHASLVHLETIEDAQNAISEFARVLVPDGYMYIHVKAQHGEEKTAVVSDTLSHHDRFFRYYSSEELTQLVERTGCIVQEVSQSADPHGRTDTTWLDVIAKKPA